MTYNELIYGFKALVKNIETFKQLDNLTDSLILYYLNTTRLSLLEQVEPSSSFYQELYKISMYKDKDNILVSNTIPSIMQYTKYMGNQTYISNIKTCSGIDIPILTEKSFDYNEYSKFSKKFVVSTYKNNRIYIKTNSYYNEELGCIHLTAIFNNPLEAEQYNSANVDYEDLEYPIPSGLVNKLYYNAIRMYIEPAYRLKQDGKENPTKEN